MPEGPEIRRMADRIEKALFRSAFSHSEFPLHPALAERLLGARPQRIDTRGKALLIRFDHGLTLYTHNQLYGRWLIKPRGQLPKTQRSLRVALHTEQHSALLFSASDIAVLDAAQLAEHPFLRKLGPDALDPATTASTVLAQLCSARFANRTLASLYLDQGFLAGIGNYLRSEILFAAGAHPRSKPRQLRTQQLQHLAELSLSITRLAYRKAGVINPQASALRARGYSREAARFLVFNRDGLPCFRCGSLIQREEIGSRRLYHCSGCQPEPTAIADF